MCLISIHVTLAHFISEEIRPCRRSETAHFRFYDAKPDFVQFISYSVFFVYTVSSGSVTVNADSSVQLLAEEAVPLDQLDVGVSTLFISFHPRTVRNGTAVRWPSEVCIKTFLLHPSYFVSFMGSLIVSSHSYILFVYKLNKCFTRSWLYLPVLFIISNYGMVVIIFVPMTFIMVSLEQLYCLDFASAANKD